MLQSCKVDGRYIVTQSPLPRTNVDFWRLVSDHECGTVVTLNPPDQDHEVLCILVC